MLPFKFEDFIKEIYGPGGQPCLKGSVQEVTTDSRQVGPGTIFIALEGENTDGHLYVEQALSKGALCCVVRLGKVPSHVSRDRLLEVAEPLNMLGRIACFVRQRLKCRVIGITGSLGKTTAKDILACILKEKYITEKAENSFNNSLGVPLTIFRAGLETEVLVSELGANHPGEINHLAGILKPDDGVITNIAPAHLEGFGSLNGVAGAKAEIVEHLPSGGTLFLNAEMVGIDAFCDCAPCRVRLFGKGTDTSYELVTNDLEGVWFRVGGYGEFFLPGCGEQHLNSAVAAIAVALHYGLTPSVIRKMLEHFVMPRLRWNIEKVGYCTLISDCYNASPDSVRYAVQSAFSLLSGVEPSGELTVVLGDMLELGTESERYHFEIGKYLALKNPARIYLVGKEIGAAEKALTKNSFDGQVKHCSDPATFANDIAEGTGMGDVILFKASRAVGLESLALNVKKLLQTREAVKASK